MPRRSRARYEDGDEPWRCRAAARSRYYDRCLEPKDPGREVCRKHGGRAGRPPGGSWSKAFGKLGRAYRDHKAGGGLYDQDRGLAVLSMNVERAGRRLVERDTPNFRARALALFRIIRGKKNSDPDAAGKALTDLGALLGRGASEDQAFEDLVRAVTKFQTRQEKAIGLRLHGAEVINRRDLVSLLAVIARLISEESPPEIAEKILGRLDLELRRGEAQLELSEGSRQATPLPSQRKASRGPAS